MRALLATVVLGAVLGALTNVAGVDGAAATLVMVCGVALVVLLFVVRPGLRDDSVG